jgi:hypothetical protein
MGCDKSDEGARSYDADNEECMTPEYFEVPGPRDSFVRRFNLELAESGHARCRVARAGIYELS